MGGGRVTQFCYEKVGGESSLLLRSHTKEGEGLENGKSGVMYGVDDSLTSPWPKGQSRRKMQWFVCQVFCFYLAVFQPILKSFA